MSFSRISGCLVLFVVILGFIGTAQATSQPMVVAGQFNSYFLDNEGTVWARGSNTYGQLGDGTTTDRAAFGLVKNTANTGPLTDVVRVASSYRHVLALKSDGTVMAWGFNQYGQLGDGTKQHRYLPVQVKAPAGAAGTYLEDVIAIDCDYDSSIAVTQDGTVYIWGQEPDPYGNQLTLPTKVEGLNNIVDVVAGEDHHFLTLRADGTVWTWGMNDYGQLGDGTTISSLTPVQVKGLADVHDIEAGQWNGYALKKDGTVWGWGLNVVGQLGDGSTIDRLTPVQMRAPQNSADPYIKDIVAISAGKFHLMALNSDGTILACGSNYFGQIGDGTTTDRFSPVKICSPQGAIDSYLQDVVDISAGEACSMALSRNGTIYYWGRLYEDGTVNNYLLPAAIRSAPVSWKSGTLSVSSITAGGLMLSWSTPTGFAVGGYRIYKDGVLMDEIAASATNYQVTGLEPEESYNFSVQAQDIGTGTWTTDGPSIDVITRPSWTGGIITASEPSSTGVALSWMAPSGFTVRTYEIFQDGVSLGTVDGSVTNYTVTGLMPDTTYTFSIQAQGTLSGLWSDNGPSIQITTRPSWIDGTLSASNITANSATLEWNPPGFAVLNYNIYQDTTLVDTVCGSTAAYQIAGLSPDTLYTFRIEAQAPSGQWTTNGPTTQLATTPTQPPVWDDGSLTASNICDYWLTLDWTSPAFTVETCRIYKNDVLIGTVDGATTSYCVTDLSPDTSYLFEVRAKDLETGLWTTTGPSTQVTTAEQTEVRFSRITRDGDRATMAVAVGGPPDSAFDIILKVSGDEVKTYKGLPAGLYTFNIRLHQGKNRIWMHAKDTTTGKVYKDFAILTFTVKPVRSDDPGIIDNGGNTILRLADNRVEVRIKQGTVPDNLVLKLSRNGGPAGRKQDAIIGSAYKLAILGKGAEKGGLATEQPLTVIVNYSLYDVGNRDPDNLYLGMFQKGDWSRVRDAAHDPVGHTFTWTINRIPEEVRFAVIYDEATAPKVQEDLTIKSGAEANGGIAYVPAISPSRSNISN